MKDKNSFVFHGMKAAFMVWQTWAVCHTMTVVSDWLPQNAQQTFLDLFGITYGPLKFVPLYKIRYSWYWPVKTPHILISVSTLMRKRGHPVQVIETELKIVWEVGDLDCLSLVSNYHRYSTVIRKFFFRYKKKPWFKQTVSTLHVIISQKKK